jgi:outer membrane protein
MMRMELKSLPLFIALLAIYVFSHVCNGTAGQMFRLDLDKCVQMALDVNASVVRSRYDLDIATSNVTRSASVLLPNVGASSVHSRWESGDRVVGDVIVATTEDRSYNASLSVDQSIHAVGIMGILESLAGRRAAQQGLRSVRQDVAYSAKQKYLSVLRTRRLLGVREEALDLSGRRLEKAEALLEVGSAVRSDVLRAKVEMSRNELDLISARNARRLAETDLKHFLRLDDEIELDLVDILEPRDLEYDFDAALGEAMSQRPDIGRGTELVKASRFGVWSERGNWLPFLRLSGGYQYKGLGFPEETGDLWDDSTWLWSFTVSLNLFDGLRTFSNVRVAKAQRRQAEEDLRQLKLDAALQVKQAFYNVEEARQRVKVSRETVELAEEELRLAEEHYRLGGGTMLEQIDSQVALSEARTSHIEALYDYLLSQAQLTRAVGKD